MQILIVAATLFEIKPLINQLGASEQRPHFFQVSDSKHDIDIVISGIGMVPMAYHLGKIFQSKKYDLAINPGIAGSFSKEIPLAEVVHVVEEVFSEVGAEDGNTFLLPEQIGFKEMNLPPFSSGKLINPNHVNTTAMHDLRKVKAITANTIHGNEDHIAQICELFHPDIETMEGAAFFYACLLEKIPFIQLRSISNYVEARNKASWEIKPAISNLHQCLIQLLHEL